MHRGISERTPISSLNNSIEGSLTKIVIAQIERHRVEQNKEMERYQRRYQEKEVTRRILVNDRTVIDVQLFSFHSKIQLEVE